MVDQELVDLVWEPRSSLLVWRCNNLQDHEPHDYVTQGHLIKGPVHCPGKGVRI